jgi:hypothetical protein
VKTIFAIIFGLCPVSAQVLTTLDLSASHGSQKFYVVLASRGGSSTGHAFVVWGIEDNARKLSSIEALGLYPENDSEQCSTAVRTVSGRVMDEMANHSVQSISYALIIRVDESDFKRSRNVAHAWDCQHEFSLWNRDCVEFVRAVGLALHLKMPARHVTRWAPQAYVRALQHRAADGTLAGNWWPATAGW